MHACIYSMELLFLVLFCRDERTVSQAIELNEQLQKVLARHDDLLLSGRVTTTANHFDCEEAEEEEEEAKQLFRRLVACLLLNMLNLFPFYEGWNLVLLSIYIHFISPWLWLIYAYGRLRKGKACARPEDEETEPHLGLLEERFNHPLIRPLSLEPSREANARPVVVPPPSAKHNGELEVPRVAIPPPPAKHIERERYFQKNKKEGATLAGHLRGLSLHSRNGSSSYSGSFDSSDSI